MSSKALRHQKHWLLWPQILSFFHFSPAGAHNDQDAEDVELSSDEAQEQDFEVFACSFCHSVVGFAFEWSFYTSLFAVCRLRC